MSIGIEVGVVVSSYTFIYRFYGNCAGEIERVADFIYWYSIVQYNIER